MFFATSDSEWWLWVHTGLDFPVTYSFYIVQTSRGTCNKEKHMIIQDIFKPPTVDIANQTFSRGAVFKFGLFICSLRLLKLICFFPSYITWSNEKCYPSLKNPPKSPKAVWLQLCCFWSIGNAFFCEIPSFCGMSRSQGWKYATSDSQNLFCIG